MKKKESDHVFTAYGIVQLNRRKFSVDSKLLRTSQGYNKSNFQKYEHNQLYFTSSKGNDSNGQYVCDKLNVFDSTKMS